MSISSSFSGSYLRIKQDLRGRRDPNNECFIWESVNIKYLGLVGNVFHANDLDEAIEKERRFRETLNSYTQKYVGLDPSFGSPSFGVCITELIDGHINVLQAGEYSRPDSRKRGTNNRQGKQAFLA